MPTFLFPLIALILAFFASPAMAEWDHVEDHQSWLVPVVAMLLGAFVIAANMKTSKRGHQD